MKLLGTLAGVPDLLFFHKSNLFAVELKARGGRLSPAQQAYADKLDHNGGFFWVGDNVDGVLSFLSHGGLLK